MDKRCSVCGRLHKTNTHGDDRVEVQACSYCDELFCMRCWFKHSNRCKIKIKELKRLYE